MVEENMHKPGKIFSFVLAMLLMGVVLAFIPRLVSASLQPDDPLPTPVSPEPYPNSDIYPAIVYIKTADDLQVLYSQNIDIGGLKPAGGPYPQSGATFQPAIATVYIDPSQAELLTQAGLTPAPIPNEGYRSFLAYGPGSGAPNAWPTFEQYVSRMQNLAAAHPNIVTGSIGVRRNRNCGAWKSATTRWMKMRPSSNTANHHGDRPA
jgi:hypothetical protein